MFTFRVSFDTHTFEDFGLGERCLRGCGEADLERRDLRYLPRDRDREELLPLLLLLSLLDDADLLFALIGVFTVFTEGDTFFPPSAGFLL